MKILLVIGALLFGIEAGAAEKDDAKWQAKMKSLADTMGELLPELVSNPGDAKVIERGAKTLSELSHDLKAGRESGKMMPPGDLDPSITLLAAEFSNQTRRAYAAIKQGQVSYGKDQLRAATAFCIACHTRHENGPSFTTFPMSDKVEKLGTEQKAELYVATRQFDKGLVEFQKLVEDKDFSAKRPFDWERALRNLMAIAVRVKQDPELASKTVASALKAPGLPEFQRDRLQKWQKAVDAWKKESPPKKKGEAAYVAEMRRLLKETDRAKLYPGDHSADVQYLRASGAAHDLMRATKNPKLIAEALLTAGTAYEALANPVFWPMHELYFEACVRQLPHSPTSQDCFNRYEQSVYFGYTGSSGTHMPADVQQHLIQLKGIASPH